MPREARVKIVATVGPASRAPERLRALVAAGVDVFRVNGAHEPVEGVAALVRAVREAGRREGRVVATLVDLPGVKARVGEIPSGSLVLARGARTTLASAVRAGDGGIPVSPAVLRAAAPGREILLGDGAVTLRAVSRSAGRVVARVVDGGVVRSRAGVHVRGGDRGGRVPTAHDLRLARAAARAGADALALSFVEREADVLRLRRALGPPRRGFPLLVAKVERRAAVLHLDEVLRAVDGVMVARGDLALDFAPEEVPPLQKRILEAASFRGRFAITATQMLESMTKESRPTRAEASDVANAVFDGTDAVMLSGETAVGDHPALVVQTMERILRAAEADPHCPYAGDPRHVWPEADADRPDRLVVRSAVRLAQDAKAAAVVVLTRGGQSARRLAKERPRAPIYAYASDASVVRGLAFSWGVRPRLLPRVRTTDEAIRVIVGRRAREGLARGARVVLAMGGAKDPAGTTSLVKLVTL
jgi:pyruvate kinase